MDLVNHSQMKLIEQVNLMENWNKLVNEITETKTGCS